MDHVLVRMWTPDICQLSFELTKLVVMSLSKIFSIKNENVSQYAYSSHEILNLRQYVI